MDTENKSIKESIKSTQETDIKLPFTFDSNNEMIFKFFYNNHHIFRMINQEDYNTLDISQNHIRQMTLLSTGGAFVTMTVLNKTLLRNLNSQTKVKKTKNLFFIAKYIAFPISTGILSFGYYRRQFNIKTSEISKKYDFASEDYNNAMLYLENAKKDGKLDELLEKGIKIDWKSIRGVHPSSM